MTKILTLALALTVAALAVAGQWKQKNAPLVIHNASITTGDIPTPPCPPACRK